MMPALRKSATVCTKRLAQALGPLNDLYRLPDSVFNDDNIHTILTGFDMLILRTAYSPELRSGMTREQVQDVLPGILSRSEPPRRCTLPAQEVSATPREWINAVQKSLRFNWSPNRAHPKESGATGGARSGKNKAGQTTAALTRTISLAAWHSSTTRKKHCSNYQIAQSNICATTPGTDIHQAYVTTQTAALLRWRREKALTGFTRTERGQSTVMTRAQNASQLATLLLLKSEALNQAGSARNRHVPSGWTVWHGRDTALARMWWSGR